MATKKRSKTLSATEKKKLWQSICSHRGPKITNTGKSGSKCSLCGKELAPPNPDK